MSINVKSACPLDCFAHCGLVASVEDGRVVKLHGDREHPLTRGITCSKAKKLLHRQYSPDRILYPMIKKKGSWKSIDWEEAYGIISSKLLSIREKYGPTSVLYHHGGGSEGLLHKLEMRFFNAFGGCTVPAGSTCWGSGYQAQLYDFGAVRAHSWDDLINSRTIVLWGRDPATTHIHLLPHLREARRRGAEIVVINPIRVPSAKQADRYVAPRPGTDGALALAMAGEIIRKELYDRNFTGKYTHGFAEFRELAVKCTPEWAEKITDIPAGEIVTLAKMIASQKPAAIVLGYGMQRYSNSGQAVRAIDALAAITGNIGIAGGGVNYANQYWKNFFGDIEGKNMESEIREMPWPTLAESLLRACAPPVKAIVVTRSNPLTQLADTNLLTEAFRRSEFTLVADFFLTDTAEAADMLLPCTTFLEEEDLFCSSWNPYLNYAARAVEPEGEAKPDWLIFSELAGVMGLPGFPALTAGEWMEKLLEPVEKYGFTLENLRQGPVKNPFSRDIPWDTGHFATPSGKYELYSTLAEKDGASPLPVYVPPESFKIAGLEEAFPLHFITSHHRDCLHSQFYNLSARGQELPEVEIHPDAAALRNISEGDLVLITSPRGAMKAVASLMEGLRRDVVQVYSGSWMKLGGGVNQLTRGIIPDMGLGTPYYDCMVEVKKV